MEAYIEQVQKIIPETEKQLAFAQQHVEHLKRALDTYIFMLRFMKNEDCSNVVCIVQDTSESFRIVTSLSNEVITRVVYVKYTKDKEHVARIVKQALSKHYKIDAFHVPIETLQHIVDWANELVTKARDFFEQAKSI